MPLPDERPRQSVANLIGRFEQQNKRQSTSSATAPPLLPRSSSVGSHVINDSANEDAKEKRERPPKSTDKPALTTSASWTNKVAPSTPKSSLPTDNPSAALTASVSAPVVSISTTPKSPTTPQKKLQPKPSSPPATSPPIAIPRASLAGASNSKSSLKSPVRSPPKSSLTTSQPLKPQHTGQSTTSATSTIRFPKLPGKSPPTQYRPKTPSRPKTPAQASRPKTPSSGLFAPTAASLAKARNVPPASTPTKKVPLSSAAAERLSKPTAASMSKARSPVPVASPARGSKAATPARGGTPAKAPLKPRVGLAPARVKAAKEENAGKATSNGITVPAVAVAAAAGGAAALEIEEDTNEVEHEHEHEEPEHYDSIPEDDVHDAYPEPELEHEDHGIHEEHPEEQNGVPEVVEHEEREPEVTHEPEVILEPEPVQVEPESSSKYAEPDVHDEVDDISTPHGSPRGSVTNDPESESTTEPVHELTSADPASALLHVSDIGQDDRMDEVKPRAHVEDDLDAMVSFLEFRPAVAVPRPESVASIPDEDAGEIPDEE